jgi:hypothetical protein
MKCITCGTVNHDEARFCRECGNALLGPSQTTTHDFSSPELARVTKNYWIALGIVVISIIITLANSSEIGEQPFFALGLICLYISALFAAYFKAGCRKHKQLLEWQQANVKATPLIIEAPYLLTEDAVYIQGKKGDVRCISLAEDLKQIEITFNKRLKLYLKNGRSEVLRTQHAALWYDVMSKLIEQ